jgi:hypothetical protein
METKKLQSLVQPAQLITVEKARELNQNFNLLRLAASEDANAVWYSLQELENYISYIKNEGNQKGYIVDGIRFYLGVYPLTEPNGRAGFTTIFLSPTGQKVQTSGVKSLLMSQGSSDDISVIQPLNFGSMGNPPKMTYGE